MAAVTAFDNINKLGEAKRRPTYTEYFEPMLISREQKRKRIMTADLIEDAVLFLFALYIAAERYGQPVDKARARKVYRDELKESLKEAGVRDSVINTYLDDVANEEVDVTAKRHLEDEYWTSYDRAITIAENDANTVWNTQEHEEAIESGKTMKQWLTMKDERVRPTHAAVDDTMVPIDEPFVVGNSLMLYPHDSSLGASPEELCGCRCSVRYM